MKIDIEKGEPVEAEEVIEEVDEIISDDAPDELEILTKHKKKNV